ncbi:efflux RND transporter periplasmic adaptor subunit [bacterium]|nr:MAG: efflux RND transporter periplasmic adaptor subunit [bacterium]
MNSSKQLSVPVVVAGIALVGGGMFWVGRSQAPNPISSPMATKAEPSRDGEHTEDEHEEHEEHGEEAIHFTPEGMKSAGVQVATVTLQPQLAGLPFNGAVEVSPDHVARVASVVSGRIVRLNVALGSRVRQGQVLAMVESRSVGEAQAAYGQAQARLQNARSNYDVVKRQAKAGVFSRAPLETARRAQSDALAEVRASETALRSAQVALDNVTRLARSGSYSQPALESSRNQYATALEEVQSASAAFDSAEAATKSAASELARRRQIAAGGGYVSRPVEEAKRVLVAAQSARATAQSEVATTRANLSRARSLSVEGLVSTRDLETAQTASQTAQSRLEVAESDERTATLELERQQKLATSNAAGNAEVGEAEARLSSSQAEVRSRKAQLQKAREALKLANTSLNRERQVSSGGIANRREETQARANLENARTSLSKARLTLSVTTSALKRETAIFRQNLNDTSQIQAAQATLVSARSDMEAAQSTLRLLQASPGSSAIIPLKAPLAGIVQERNVAQGESIEADKNLFTIANLDIVHVDMFLPERDIAKVGLGSPVNIVVDAVPGRSFDGTIELIHTELDTKTRTVEAHAEIANPGMLRPGMFARGVIRTGSSSMALLVPTDAVQDLEGKKVVFVAGEKAGEFVAREVTIGTPANGNVAVKTGLKPGEKVVVKGAFMVKAQAMKAELGHEH